jgi:hypothetical protein
MHGKHTVVRFAVHINVQPYSLEKNHTDGSSSKGEAQKMEMVGRSAKKGVQGGLE